MKASLKLKLSYLVVIFNFFLEIKDSLDKVDIKHNQRSKYLLSSRINVLILFTEPYNVSTLCNQNIFMY